MSVLKFVAFALFLGLAQTAFSATVMNTEISKIMIDRGHGNLVFVKAEGSKANPSCHANSAWSFVMPLETDNDKAMYSALLSAKVSGKKVTLIGSDSCEFYSGTSGSTGVETLIQAEVQ